MAKKGEAKVIFTAEVSGFTEGISKINKSLGNLKSDLKLANTELKANGNSIETLTNKKKALSSIVEQNAEKIELLQKKLASCKTHLGENSTEYQRLYKQLNNAKGEQARFQAELKETERALDSMGDELQDTGDDFKDFDKGIKTSSDGFTVFKGALADLASGGIQFAIDKIADFASYLLDLPEATEEFRINMAKLTGATQQYGYDVEDTNEKVKEMYGYFGDEQIAVNAITNLQGLGLSQTELNTTLDAGVAVWTAYGDSIPIESLTESINETAQVGKVTGVLADALNWAGISEDEFNKKLEATKGTQERAKLVTDTLNKAYGESKAAFDQATQGARESRQAQYDLAEQEALTAQAIEPLTTKLDGLKAKLLYELNPAIEETADKMSNAVDQTSSWVDELNEFNNTGLGQMTLDALKGIGQAFMDLIYPIEMNRQAHEKWASEFGAIDSVVNDIKDSLYWLGDVYDGMKNKGMSFYEAMNYATGNWGRETGTALNEVAKVHNEKFDLMKRSADDSMKNSQRVVKDCLKDTENSLHQFDPSWKLSKPSTTDAEQQRERLLTSTTSKLTSYNPSWRISKPNTSQAQDTSWLNTIRSRLSSFSPSWSIPKPRLPRISVSTRSIGVGDLSIPIPTFSVSWNALGGIFKRPTIFNTPNGLQGVGEAGAEAILPLDSFYRHLDNKIDEVNAGSNIIINMNDFHIHDNLDINTLTEQIAFQVQRKTRF